MSVLLSPFGYSKRTFLTIGHTAVSIDGIVVVQTTVRIDNLDIVSVPRVSRAHPPIRRRQ